MLLTAHTMQSGGLLYVHTHVTNYAGDEPITAKNSDYCSILGRGPFLGAWSLTTAS